MASHRVLLSAVVLFDVVLAVSGTFRQFGFSASSVCPASQCLSQTQVLVGSRVECAVTCSARSECSGFSFVFPRSCTHYSESCVLPYRCSHGVDITSVYKKHDPMKVCLNNGQWNDQFKSCTCRDGWVGNTCQRIAYRCKELYLYGYEPGIHRVDIDVFMNMSRLIHTQCELQLTSWRTFMFASDGKIGFNKTWGDYVNGFEKDSWNTWLGLQNAYAFNQMGHLTVSFAVVIQAGQNFMWEYIYNNFKMEDAVSGYAYRFDYAYKQTSGHYSLSSQHELGDVLTRTQGLPFSTYDMDQDLDNENCASLSGAGWWFDNCTSAQRVNPLGVNPLFVPLSPEMSRMCLPGINTSDHELLSNFQSVLMTFID